ncbi:ATP-dependent Clp protease ATP-binding subunit, partial [Mycobacterium tuberculosis]|nr:ATP-dependent Clp protease ATP-binding subunit [Mycobacterium tuberculosis]
VSSGLQMGFQVEGDTKTNYDRMKQRVNEELKQHFRPEFLNRVDDTIVFPQLNKEEIIEIVDLFLERLDTRLADQGMKVELTDAAKNLLADRGYDPVLGARPLRRTIQLEIEDQLSEKILFKEIGRGQTIKVDIEGEGKDAKFTFDGVETETFPTSGGDD